MLGRYLFPKLAARLLAARVSEQALGLALSEEGCERALNGKT
jgi:hypothetical protein